MPPLVFGTKNPSLRPTGGEPDVLTTPGGYSRTAGGEPGLAGCWQRHSIRRQWLPVFAPVVCGNQDKVAIDRIAHRHAVGRVPKSEHVEEDARSTVLVAELPISSAVCSVVQQCRFARTQYKGFIRTKGFDVAEVY